jgi:hypothetical protein
MLSWPILRGNNGILYSPVVNQGEEQSLSNLRRYDKNIYRTGYISQEGA